MTSITTEHYIQEYNKYIANEIKKHPSLYDYEEDCIKSENDPRITFLLNQSGNNLQQKLILSDYCDCIIDSAFRYKFYKICNVKKNISIELANVLQLSIDSLWSLKDICTKISLYFDADYTEDDDEGYGNYELIDLDDKLRLLLSDDDKKISQMIFYDYIDKIRHHLL